MPVNKQSCYSDLNERCDIRDLVVTKPHGEKLGPSGHLRCAQTPDLARRPRIERAALEGGGGPRALTDVLDWAAPARTFHTCVHGHVYMLVYVCRHSQVCACTYLHMHVSTHVHAQITQVGTDTGGHTCTHTCSWRCVRVGVIIYSEAANLKDLEGSKREARRSGNPKLLS